MLLSHPPIHPYARDLTAIVIRFDSEEFILMFVFSVL